MATVQFTGNAQATPQVDTFTPGGVSLNAVYTVTENDKSISYTATGADTAATVCTAIVNLLNAKTAPTEFQEKTWAVVGSTFTATAKAAGKPFTIIVSTSGGGTLSHSTTTASSGPNDVSLAANYSAGALPTNGDDLIIANTNTSLLYNLGALSAVNLNSLTVYSSFTGTIGLPVFSGTGANAYQEYRATYFAISTATLTIGTGDGNGSGRIKIDTGSNACTINVNNTSTGLDTGLEAFLWKGSNAANSLAVNKGSVGVAVLSGETANLTGGWHAGYISNPAGDVTLRFGAGVTFSSAVGVQSGGTVTLNSNMVTVNKYGGTMNHEAGTLTNCNNYGGAWFANSTGTVTTGVCGSTGNIDFREDMRPKTWTNLSVYKGATVHNENQSATFTNGISGIACDPINDCSIWPGTNVKLAISSL